MTTTGRLLQLLSLLQTPREWPGPELARRLEVTERTIRNDVDRLRGLGYPVEATRGAIGGYRLAAGTAMPPLLLEDDEAVAITVALRTVGDGGIGGMVDTAQSALAKLNRVLPRRLAAQVDGLSSSVERATWWPTQPRQDTGVDAGLLTLLSSVIEADEVLRFGYADHAGAQTERRVEPYRLVNLGRRWYLVAFDLERDDWRTFRLDRVAAVEVADGGVADHGEPPRFDAGWLEVRAEAALVGITVTEPARWIAEYYPVRSITAVKGGWRIELLVADPAWLRALLLRLGPDVLAVDPPTAADSARAAASEALALYQALPAE